MLMGHVRPASATSEAIEAEVWLKVWAVLHPRAVGEGGVGERSERRGVPASEASLPPEASQVAAEGSGLRVYYTQYWLNLSFCEAMWVLPNLGQTNLVRSRAFVGVCTYLFLFTKIIFDLLSGKIISNNRKNESCPSAVPKECCCCSACSSSAIWSNS